jgi:predicted O-methyltransferase YrrM
MGRLIMRVIPRLLLYSVGLAEAWSSTLPAEIECLLRHAQGKRRLVEIGVLQGCTTRRLREVMAPDGVLFAIDPFPPGRFGFSAHRLIAQREVAKVRNGTVHWLRCTGEEAGRQHARLGEHPVDFVFVDAGNTFDGRKGDWDAWSGHISPGGIVALHASRSSPSYNIAQAGSVQHTNQVVLQDRRFTVVDTVDNLVVLRRLPT